MNKPIVQRHYHTVGIKTAFVKPKGEIPFLKYIFSIDLPAGFGALAITVKPPPVTALTTTAYFNAGDN